jgi:hypothetical protein
MPAKKKRTTKKPVKKTQKKTQKKLTKRVAKKATKKVVKGKIVYRAKPKPRRAHPKAGPALPIPVEPAMLPVEVVVAPPPQPQATEELIEPADLTTDALANEDTFEAEAGEVQEETDVVTTDVEPTAEKDDDQSPPELQ